MHKEKQSMGDNFGDIPYTAGNDDDDDDERSSKKDSTKAESVTTTTTTADDDGMRQSPCIQQHAAAVDPVWLVPPRSIYKAFMETYLGNKTLSHKHTRTHRGRGRERERELYLPPTPKHAVAI